MVCWGNKTPNGNGFGELPWMISRLVHELCMCFCQNVGDSPEFV